MTVVFIDCETSGLDPARHEPWEVALIEENGTEHVWTLPIDQTKADLIALNIGGYFDRFDYANVRYDRGTLSVNPRTEFAREFQALTIGAHLVGAVPSFDANMIGALMLRHGVIPAWHYHLIDVETLAVGAMAERNGARLQAQIAAEMAPPWRSESLSLLLGVDPGEFERHTALGDARWAKAIYEAVMGR